MSGSATHPNGMWWADITVSKLEARLYFNTKIVFFHLDGFSDSNLICNISRRGTEGWKGSEIIELYNFVNTVLYTMFPVTDETSQVQTCLAINFNI